MPDQLLDSAIDTVPPGRWAVGVSGGADSVALLALLRRRADLSLHVVHLDHQTRGQASTGDAQFVRDLAQRWGLACTIALRCDIEAGMGDLPANPSARYRAVRMELFRRVVQAQQLAGVILAHHADDQAETVLHRVLRGSGPSGLGGMESRTTIGPLTVLRPLLTIRRDVLRNWLLSQDQPWREDHSNQSPKYLRNRLRQALQDRPALTDDLLSLADDMASLRRWVSVHAPTLAPAFPVQQLRSLPPILARESARRWLLSQGVPADEILPDVVDRLLLMASDAASPARQHFPGRVLVRRRAGVICAETVQTR